MRKRQDADGTVNFIPLFLSLVSHNPFQLAGVRTFLQLSPLQTRLKKKCLKGTNWKSEEKNISAFKTLCFYFSFPIINLLIFQSGKLLRSKCSLSICVRTKIKSTTVWKPKWNAVQSVWLVTHRRAGNWSLEGLWAGVHLSLKRWKVRVCDTKTYALPDKTTFCHTAASRRSSRRWSFRSVSLTEQWILLANSWQDRR